MKILRYIVPALVAGIASAASAAPVADSDLEGYLFVYFTSGKDGEAIRYGVSDDAFRWHALNDNLPVISSKAISQTGGVRDPHILRREDGKGFYMVATDMVAANGWDSNRAMVLMKSKDLVNWDHTVINIQDRFPEMAEGLKRVWAPQTIYDPAAGRYLVYWSMKHDDGPDIIYYSYANDDFTDLTDTPRPFFLPADGMACIDGDIVVKDGKYYLFYKTEGHGNGIKVAVTDNLTSGHWTESPDYKNLTRDKVEGAGTFKLIGRDEWVLMYDVYTSRRYDFNTTTDLSTFHSVDHAIEMDFKPRHGTVIALTGPELARIRQAFPSAVNPEQTVTATSPDGAVSLTVSCPDGIPSYSLSLDGTPILLDSPLGLATSSTDYTSGMRLVAASEAPFTKHYTQTRIKQSSVDVEANRLDCTFVNPDGRRLGVEFIIKNNDVAFRYLLPKQTEEGSARVMREATGFRFPAETTTFLSPQSTPMIGWKRSKPSYEEEYTPDAPLTARSKFGEGFTFPGLFHINGPKEAWALVSETGVDSRYCASRLLDADSTGLFRLGFPMPGENNGNGTLEPAFALPGSTPWRTISFGSTPAPIAESTIYWDVVEPLYEAPVAPAPGRSTWSWILWQDNSINASDLREFVDLAAAMGYEYTLIDAGWDKTLGRDGMEALFEYGRERGVAPFVWYSSSGYWNDIVQSPINRMDNPIARKEEMRWLRDNGVKGIKVDFFGGDKQETIRLYEAILSDAADHGLMVIFHGCTLPRGWERMYPNYVGSEAVLASENMVFQQHFCDTEAFNATLHPVIRNSVGSMEWGGTFLNRRLSRDNRHGSERRTSDAFQLATTVLYQNPIQNFALAPNNLTDAPAWALDYMKAVPTTWDETRYIDGYPGRYVVLARRHGDDWRIAAVNASTEPLDLSLNLADYFAPGTEVTLISDNARLESSPSRVKAGKKPLRVTVPVNGAALITR